MAFSTGPSQEETLSVVLNSRGPYLRGSSNLKSNLEVLLFKDPQVITLVLYSTASSVF